VRRHRDKQALGSDRPAKSQTCRSGYLTSSPVTARPMIIRWISLVPSKMVKILAIGAVYAGQRPAAPPGISTDSAPPVRDEFRLWAGPVRDRRPGRRHAPAGGEGRPGSWRTPSAARCSRSDAAGTSEVYLCADLHIYLIAACRPCGRAARGTGGTGMPGTPGWPLSRRHGAAMGRTRHNAGMPCTGRCGTRHWHQMGSAVAGSAWASASSLHESFGCQFYPVPIRV
jgi:hypothetical protein